MFMRFYHLLLLPVGFVGSLLGALVWRGRGRAVLAVWLVSNIVFFFIAGEVHRVHEYYQLPFVVIAAIYFGAVAWPVFDGAWLRSHLGDGMRPVVLAAVVLTVAAVSSFYASGVTESHFAPRGMAQEMLQAGQAIDAVTADNDLAVVVDNYGIMSPILLYFAHLKGWSFDPGDLVARGGRQPAPAGRPLLRHHAVVASGEHAARRHELPRALREVTVPGAPRDTVVRDLRRSR